VAPYCRRAYLTCIHSRRPSGLFLYPHLPQ